MFVVIDYLNLVSILLTEEILHHLGCIKPVTNGINYLSTGAGFFPSTVVSFVADSHNMWKLVMSIATRVTYACWFGSKYMANRPQQDRVVDNVGYGLSLTPWRLYMGGKGDY